MSQLQDQACDGSCLRTTREGKARSPWAGQPHCGLPLGRTLWACAGCVHQGGCAGSLKHATSAPEISDPFRELPLVSASSSLSIFSTCRALQVPKQHLEPHSCFDQAAMAVLFKEGTALCHRHSASRIEVKFTSAHSIAHSATLSPALTERDGRELRISVQRHRYRTLGKASLGDCLFIDITASRY